MQFFNFRLQAILPRIVRLFQPSVGAVGGCMSKNINVLGLLYSEMNVMDKSNKVKRSRYNRLDIS